MVRSWGWAGQRGYYPSHRAEWRRPPSPPSANTKGVVRAALESGPISRMVAISGGWFLLSLHLRMCKHIMSRWWRTFRSSKIFCKDWQWSSTIRFICNLKMCVWIRHINHFILNVVDQASELSWGPLQGEAERSNIYEKHWGKHMCFTEFWFHVIVCVIVLQIFKSNFTTKYLMNNFDGNFGELVSPPS